MKRSIPTIWLTLSLLAAVLLWPSLAQARELPRVDARAALLMDQSSGRTLYAINADRPMAIASLTKLMTARLVMEKTTLDQRIPAVQYQAQAAESQIGLRPGEVMTVRDLLLALLLESANDAAATLAQGVDGSVKAFVHDMNLEARRLNLKRTHFANPVGLDQDNHYSSATDLARLARRLMHSRFFRQSVASPRRRLTSGDRVRTVRNRNTLVGLYKFVKGIKTGHTAEAGYSLVGAATRNGLRLISVVLGAPTEQARDADTLALFEYGFKHYTVLQPVRRNRGYASTKVRYHGGVVRLVAGKDMDVTVRRGQRPQLDVRAPREVKSTKKGEPLGRATALVGGKRVAGESLRAAQTVAEAGVLGIAVYYLTRPLTLLGLAVILLIGGFYVRRAIISSPRDEATNAFIRLEP